MQKHTADFANETAGAAALSLRMDVLAEGFAQTRGASFARVRASSGVARSGPATLAIARHSDVASLLEDRRLGHRVSPGLEGRFASVPSLAGASAMLGGVVSSLDPPEHSRVRRMMMKALARVAATNPEREIEATWQRLIEPVLDGRCFDATRDLALPLQVSATCRLLGVPDPDRDAVMDRASRLGRSIILAPLFSERLGNGTSEAGWLRDYVRDLLRRRRQKPRADLVSAMLSVEDAGGRLSEAEIIDNAVFCLFAGFETAVQLVSGILVALARFPDQHARLQADRALIPSAVEEVLRFESPLQWVSRFTLETIRVAGKVIPPGRLLLLLLGSANRDERFFSSPNTIDVARRPNRHLAFGGGEHHCMNRARVRGLGALVLTRLLERGVRLELWEKPRLLDHPAIRLYASAPMRAIVATGSERGALR